MKITLVTFKNFKSGRQPKPISLYSQMAGSPADSQGVKVHLSMMGSIG